MRLEILSGTALPMRGDDIDTDRIIPARYLKCVTFEELGQYAFYDERFPEGGQKKEHPFNDGRFRGAKILVVNKNFGCGSSREHAPQSLMRWGFAGIIGESFAEIFAGNCTAIGVPAVTASASDVDALMHLIEEKPSTVVAIDLAKKRISVEGGAEYPLSMNESTRKSLIDGSWDTTSQLSERTDQIRELAASLPYISGYSR